MSQKDDCYIIEEDDLLEPVRRLQRGSTKAGGSLRGLDATVRASRRGSGGRGGSGAPLASSLSLFICGAGQVANGQLKLGLLLFLTEVLALAGHWCVLKADRKSTRLNSSHLGISYAVFCLKKKQHTTKHTRATHSLQEQLR